jgi:hypothetical protein
MPAKPTKPGMKRPGWVTFAAAMMFLAGALDVISALNDFKVFNILGDVSQGYLGDRYLIWGLIDLVIGAVFIYTGYSIMKGQRFGFVVGLIFAGVNVLRWIFYIPLAPIAALIVSLIGILIFFGLINNEEYFVH